jgi:hypothetical protein
MSLTYLRVDELVQDPMGAGASGTQVFLCNQPTDTSVIPPTNLATVWADSAGSIPLDQVTAGGVTPTGALRASQQIQTDQNGECFFYALPGLYTHVYYSPRMCPQTLVLVDQALSPIAQPQYVSESTNNGITPNINGTAVAFQLSQAPNPPGSLVLSLNGLIIPGYAFSGSQVILETAPKVGDTLSALYQV